MGIILGTAVLLDALLVRLLLVPVALRLAEEGELGETELAWGAEGRRGEPGPEKGDAPVVRRHLDQGSGRRGDDREDAGERGESAPRHGATPSASMRSIPISFSSFDRRIMVTP